MTDERKKLVEENHDLIYWYLHKNNLDVEEYYDVAAIGLCHAAEKYDKKKGAFSTIAIVCIQHEIYRLWKKEKAAKQIPFDKILSYDATYSGDDGDTVTLLDNLQDSSLLLEDKVISEEYLDYIASKCNEMGQQIIQMLRDGKSTKEIIDMLGVTKGIVMRQKEMIWRIYQRERRKNM